MIHINLDGWVPDADWLARAEAITQQLLKDGLTEEKRNAIIDANCGLWRELEPWLKDISHGKCWYSEARDCASYWHVDHFRPKKELKDENGDTYEGYWWLAFDWKNYRLSGGAVNVPKSTKFPVREGTQWACDPDDDVDDEFPCLLDPIRPEDPGLLAFDEQGKAGAAKPNNKWLCCRAEMSIDVLNLNYSSLVRGRKLVWDTCKRYAQQVLDCHATISQSASVSQKQQLKNGVLHLRHMVCCKAEFSAVAVACICAMGDSWLERTILGG